MSLRVVVGLHQVMSLRVVVGVLEVMRLRVVMDAEVKVFVEGEEEAALALGVAHLLCALQFRV